ncbi:MAG: prephenate dehydrogenase/arogenate dehydrogenase family protein [Tissierellia bacterium]|nr:prephenate dehydrogenase/arogenate dehydrogenase family protein [Tissierellia bacterium]
MNKFIEKSPNLFFIGFGLMGGSLCKSLRNRGYQGEIMVWDRNKQGVKQGIEEKVINYGTYSIKEGTKFADIVILATPLHFFRGIISQLTEVLDKEILLLDLGSVKGKVAKDIEIYGNDKINYIGLHPMTGSEKSGYNHANPYLYDNAYCFVCPSKDVTSLDLECTLSFVESFGAKPVIISPQEHDEIVGTISHLPHVLSSALVHVLIQNNPWQKAPYIGGGFRDTTRIAQSSPNMWVDIFLDNREDVLKGIDSFQNILENIKEDIQNNRTQKIYNFLEEARLWRSSLPKHRQGYYERGYIIFVSLPDKKGVLAEITTILKDIDIRELEIVHSRNREGALRLLFLTFEDQSKASSLLKNKGYQVEVL